MDEYEEKTNEKNRHDRHRERKHSERKEERGKAITIIYTCLKELYAVSFMFFILECFWFQNTKRNTENIERKKKGDTKRQNIT